MPGRRSPEHPGARWLLATIIVSFALALTGCPADPYDPKTWIKKLEKPSDRAELERAITELERLDDPVAIEPLARAWRRHNRPNRVLRTIIRLAGQSKEGDGKFWEGGPYWDRAIPVLVEALEEFDLGHPPSIENAVLAAEALGRARDPSTVQALINTVNKVMPRLSPGQRVRIASIQALGHFGNDPRAVNTLIKVMDAELEDQRIELFGATANALAETRSELAIPTLMRGLYVMSPIYQQLRRALIAVGPPVIPEMIKTLKGEHKAMNELAAKNDFNVDCRRDGRFIIGPGTRCLAPTNLEFKAASILGDLYAKEAVAPLLAGLKQPGLPAFFEQGAPGPSQHAAILDALRKIGDPGAAAAVLAYARADDTDDLVRPLAIDVYSQLAADTAGLSWQATQMRDEDEQIRLSSGLAYARLVRDKKDLAGLQRLITEYKDRADKADKELEAKNKALEAAQKALDAAVAEKRDAARPQAAVDRAQQEHSMAQHQAVGYRMSQRTFEQHLARANVGVLCGADLDCYVAYLSKDTAAVVKDMEPVIKGLGDWEDGQKRDLRIAATERALLEISKMGEKARPAMDVLLERAISTDRIVRQGILLALVQVAETPCQRCVDRLDHIIREQREQTTLAALTVDTQAVRNYFLWAGK